MNKYPVREMRKIKADHETKYSQIEDKMNATITDQALDSVPTEAVSLIGLLGEPDKDRPNEVRRVRKYAARLRELPIETRQLLSIAVRRAYAQAVRQRDVGGRGSSTVNPVEVQKATGLAIREVREQLRILGRVVI